MITSRVKYEDNNRNVIESLHLTCNYSVEIFPLNITTTTTNIRIDEDENEEEEVGSRGGRKDGKRVVLFFFI